MTVQWKKNIQMRHQNLTEPIYVWPKNDIIHYIIIDSSGDPVINMYAAIGVVKEAMCMHGANACTVKHN